LHDNNKGGDVMQNKGYQSFVDAIIEKEPIDVPIYTKDVAEKVATEFNLPIDKARAYTNVALKRNLERGSTKRFMKGVYYKPIKSVFGEKNLNGDLLALAQLTENDSGYITGATLLNKLGLSTLLPKNVQVATNRYRTRFTYKTSVVPVRVPYVITKECIKYFQILDAIKWMNKLSVDAIDPKLLIKQYIINWGCDSTKLILLAKKYYDTDTLKIIIEILFEKEV